MKVFSTVCLVLWFIRPEAFLFSLKIYIKKNKSVMFCLCYEDIHWDECSSFNWAPWLGKKVTNLGVGSSAFQWEEL